MESANQEQTEQVEAEPTEKAEDVAREPPVAEAAKTGHKVLMPLRSPRPKKPGRYAKAFELNPLSALACVLGLISLVLPWAYFVDPHEVYLNLGHYLLEESDARFAVAAGLILVGSLSCLFVTFGGILQLLGAALFLTAVADDLGGQYNHYLWGSLSIGFFFVLVGGILGSVTLVFRPKIAVSDRFLTVHISGPDRRVLVNYVALAGAALGIISVFLPWAVVTTSYYAIEPRSDYFSLLSFGGGYVMSLAGSLALALVLFGSLLCLISPVGMVSQIAGILVFAVFEYPEFGSFGASYYRQSSALGLGIIIAILSWFIALASLFFTWRLALPAKYLAVRRVPPSEGAQGGLSRPSVEDITLVPRAKLTRRGMVVLTSVVVVAIVVSSSALVLAYTQPLAKLMVSLGNNSDFEASVAIYIDGDRIDSSLVSGNGYMLFSHHVAGGRHKVGLDYGYPSRDPNDTLDGRVDWTTYVVARPLGTTGLYLSIGTEQMRYSEVTMTVTGIPAGKKIEFTFVGTETASFGLVQTSIQWDDMVIVLDDGVNSTRWDPWSFSLYNSSGIGRASLTAMSLGALSILCNVTDLGGNGAANQGDYFTFEIEAGGAFSAGVTYTVYILSHGEGGSYGSVSFTG